MRPSRRKHVDQLKADTIKNWHRDLAKAPRLMRTKRGAAQRRTKPVRKYAPRFVKIEPSNVTV